MVGDGSVLGIRFKRGEPSRELPCADETDKPGVEKYMAG